MKKRVDWIDTARFWGMFFIYLGHFADAAGKAFPWVFSFHVPLFFFLLGCVENYNRRNVAQNLWHKVVHTLLPFYVFGLMSIALNVILTDSQESLSVHLRILLMGGIRNGITLGGGLWFLSCLFVIQIAFSIISQIKSRPVMFAVCLGIYLIAELAVGSLFTLTPHWWYNADSACYYLIYYCVGWFTFP